MGVVDLSIAMTTCSVKPRVDGINALQGGAQKNRLAQKAKGRPEAA